MPKTTEDKAYERLRKMLFAGELPVGEFLSQRKLASEAGASVISVRPALRRLESEGLLENVPKWGVRIPVETADEIRDRYLVREILEVSALHLMLDRLGPVIAAKLKEFAETADAITGESDDGILAFAEAHRAYHRHIAESSGSPLLATLLDRVTNRGSMLSNARRVWGAGRDRGGRHHGILTDAILGGDAAKAETALREHIHRGLDGELLALTDDD